MCSSLSQFIHLGRLKIPWLNKPCGTRVLPMFFRNEKNRVRPPARQDERFARREGVPGRDGVRARRKGLGKGRSPVPPRVLVVRFPASCKRKRSEAPLAQPARWKAKFSIKSIKKLEVFESFLITSSVAFENSHLLIVPIKYSQDIASSAIL